MKNSPNFLEEMSNFIFTSKYARFDEKKKRRETWDEAVTRVEKMHLRKYHFLEDSDKAEIKKAFNLVREKLVIPSMRSLQFGGKAVEASNVRNYNCAVRHIDSIRAFSESFYVLLCGTGIGFGITDKFLNRLPDLVEASDKTGSVVNYLIQDTIEGWADSLQALLECYFKNTALSGRKICFDYSKIREEGAPLKTSGGKAPGYRGLKNCHIKVKKLLDYIIEEKNQKRLKTINAYDILMHTADAVLSGGVRRSACLVAFSIDDADMMFAKTDKWNDENPQRARSNNSVLIVKNKTPLEKFKHIFNQTKQFGEPGFIFVEDENQLINPCAEISFIPITKDGICGFQFCNLTSINGAQVDSFESFERATKAASIIGTLQAGYTKFPYLSHSSEQLTEEESLLGVSITGMCEHPDVLFNSKHQKECAELAVKTNQIWAKKLKIKPAARVTCIKPEGTGSLVLKSSSGIHPHHARKYIRRVQCNKHDNVYKYFKLFNAHACEASVWSANKTDDIISFPVEVSPAAMIKSDLDSFKHLDLIKLTQKNWVSTGTTEFNTKPLHHSVSCTVMVKESDWEKICEYLFNNQNYFTAVSLIPEIGDKIYKQAPMEAILTPEDEIKFNDLIKNWNSVDYTKLEEVDDETHHITEASCVGGACQIV